MAWAPDYVDAAELAAYVRVADDVDDEQMQLAVSAASRAVDETTHRQFGGFDEPVTMFYTARWDAGRRRWVVDIDDVFGGIEEVRLDGDDVAVDDFVLTPRNAQTMNAPFERVEVLSTSSVQPTTEPDDVAVTAAFGWPTVPDAVKQATLLQASRLLIRRDAPFGVAGSPDQGSEVRLLAKVDPDVAVTLRPYVRRQLRVG